MPVDRPRYVRPRSQSSAMMSNGSRRREPDAHKHASESPIRLALRTSCQAALIHTIATTQLISQASTQLICALRLRLATAERIQRRNKQGSRTAPSSARTPPSAGLTLALDSAFAQRDAARSQIHSEVMKLAERYKALEKTLRELQDTLKAKDKEIESLRKERDRLIAERDQEREKIRSMEAKAEAAAAQHQNHQQNGVNGPERHLRNREPSRSRKLARRSVDGPSAPLAPTMSLEAEHAARARNMDVFLTKTDSWSGAQIIQAVEDLNAEISHFAASATESCVFAKRTISPKMLLQNMADPGRQEQQSTPWLGPALCYVLATRDHTQDPILVQLALQASIATCCARSLSLFCVGFPSKLDALLCRVLAQMHSSEPQATSSRWRALTHRSIRVLYPGLEEYAISELVTTMLRWSTAVFTLSGSSPAADLARPPSPGLSSLRTQMRRIAEAVYKLARVTREEILSTSFEVVLVEGGEPFEEGQMTNKMREGEPVPGDNHEKVSGGEAGSVLCTTELGLRCVTRKDGRDIDLDDEDGGDVFERRMLLPPKVVLDSAMEVIERG
ncbi:hypothetical protein A0H81_07927 [Grifola frondosa]|uniref:Uncharacterized protein n=1 Tax=Grifola frondosa TaxID=5627 RepID=A0A1C7M650_GRIFR|nr:hypothetical protein A0H81_07927 [Grifola frondosa]